MNTAYVAPDGTLYTEVIMTRTQLLDALRAYLQSEEAGDPKNWCENDVRDVELAVRRIRRALSNQSPEAEPEKENPEYASKQVPVGWRCPVCNAGLSPWVSVCPNSHLEYGANVA